MLIYSHQRGEYVLYPGPMLPAALRVVEPVASISRAGGYACAMLATPWQVTILGEVYVGSTLSADARAVVSRCKLPVNVPYTKSQITRQVATARAAYSAT